MRDTSLWAAIWWADQLRSGRVGQGTGDAHFEMSIGLVVGLLGEPKVSDAQIVAFENALATRIDTLLDDIPQVDLYRDYDTPVLLMDAMKDAGVTIAADLKFPNKTGMRIAANHVWLKLGYGANYEQVFP